MPWAFPSLQHTQQYEFSQSSKISTAVDSPRYVGVKTPQDVKDQLLSRLSHCWLADGPAKCIVGLEAEHLVLVCVKFKSESLSKHLVKGLIIDSC